MLQLAGAATDLAVLGERASRHDATCLVRLVADGDVLAAFVATPFECLGMRAVRLAEPASLDAVVEAVGLVARARSAEGGRLEPPPPLPPVTWTLPLPPRHGWQPVGTLPAREVAERVERDTAEFRQRAGEVPAGRAAAAVLEGVAHDLWGRTFAADHPARLTHAAAYLGFVPDEGEVTLRSAGVWRRLDTPLGVTLARASDPLGLLVS